MWHYCMQRIEHFSIFISWFTGSPTINADAFITPFMITSFISCIELRNHLGRLYNNTTVHTWFNAQASVVAPCLRSVTETGHAGQGDGYIYIQPLQSSTGQVVWWYCQHVDLQVRHCLAKKENHITYAYSKSIFQGVVYMPWIDSSISWYQDVKIHSLF